MKTSNKKVVLCYPVISGYDNDDSTITQIPLSLLYVAGPLVMNGYEVVIVDSRIKGWEEKLKVSLKDAVCAGISCFVAQIPSSLNIAKLIKNNFPELPIVWGGWYPTTAAEHVISSPYVDIIVRGEGEETFLELVDNLSDSQMLDTISGITFKNNGSIVSNPDRPVLKEYPSFRLPYNLLDHTKYDLSLGRALIVTSRGCPYRCAYCTIKTFYNRRWTAMSAQAVLDNFEQLYRKYNVRQFDIHDDNFFVNKKRVQSIFEGILDYDWKIKWTSVGNIKDLKKMDYKMFKLAKDSGCFKIRAGIETGSPRIMDLIDKHFNVEDVIKVAEILADLDIEFRPSFILGLPKEKDEDIYLTLDLVKRLIEMNPSKLPAVFMYHPIPGTKLYFEELQEGLLTEYPNLDGWGHISWKNIAHAWYVTPDTVHDYRVRERNRVRMISFYFRFAYARRFQKKFKKGPLKYFWKLMLVVFQYMAMLRYNFKFFFIPFEWNLYRKLRSG
jgi:radical SAM superfamily enzyme YgiQ (UPF0313 family)